MDKPCALQHFKNETCTRVEGFYDVFCGIDIVSLNEVVFEVL